MSSTTVHASMPILYPQHYPAEEPNAKRIKYDWSNSSGSSPTHSNNSDDAATESQTSSDEYYAPILSEPVNESEKELITLESKFSSFKEFEETFETWKRKHLHPFRVASSEALREPDGTVNQHFKYRYVVYHCAHYGEPRMRGAGKRPNQSYLPCGCRAMLRLNYNFAEQCLKITTLNAVHNDHDVSMEMYMKVSQKIRRSMAGGSRRSSVGSRSEDKENSPFPTRANTPKAAVAAPLQLIKPQQPNIMCPNPMQQMLAAYQLQQQSLFASYLTHQNVMYPPQFSPSAPEPTRMKVDVPNVEKENAPPKENVREEPAKETISEEPRKEPIREEPPKEVVREEPPKDPVVPQKPVIVAPIPIRPKFAEYGSAFEGVAPKDPMATSIKELIDQVQLKLADNEKREERAQELRQLLIKWI